MKDTTAFAAIATLITIGVGGATFVAGRLTAPRIIAAQSSIASFAAITNAAPGTVNFTAHDAAGRTRTATATYNSFSADGKILAIDYTTDQYLCSGFEPGATQ